MRDIRYGNNRVEAIAKESTIDVGGFADVGSSLQTVKAAVGWMRWRHGPAPRSANFRRYP